MLSPVDLDALDPAIHHACLSLAHANELHATQLGLGGVERIAGKIERLVYRYRLQFVFTRLEKLHLAGTKFVDTLIDSGLNGAVSNLHYGVRISRLYFAHVIVEYLDLDDREEFWVAYQLADAKGFCRILRRLEGRIESRVTDPRTRQLLLDAIHWAIAHPEPLIEGTRSNLDSPNVVALGLLIHVLHSLNRDNGLKVGAFVHDEQKQFAKSLRQAFDVSKRHTAAKGNSPLALMTDIRDMDTFPCEFRSANSKTSFGLQILDVVVWLIKAPFRQPGRNQGQSAATWHNSSLIRERSYLSLRAKPFVGR